MPCGTDIACRRLSTCSASCSENQPALEPETSRMRMVSVQRSQLGKWSRDQAKTCKLNHKFNIDDTSTALLQGEFAIFARLVPRCLRIFSRISLHLSSSEAACRVFAAGCIFPHQWAKAERPDQYPQRLTLSAHQGLMLPGPGVRDC